MPDENLLKYIRDGLAMGRTEDILRPLLQRSGWKEEDVNEAFRVVHGGAPASAPESVSPSPQQQPQIQPQPQIQSQIQPQIENMPQRPTRSGSGGMGRWIAGGAIALVAVAGGAWAAYAFFVPPSPQQVLDAMFQKGFADINSMNMDMAVATDVRITPATSSASSSLSLTGGAANPLGGYAAMFLGNGSSEVKLSLDASGTLIVNPANVRSSDENVAATVTINNGGQSASFSGSGEVRALPDATYFNIAMLPNFGFFNASALEGKWIEFPTTTYDTGASSLAVSSSTLSPTDAARLTTAAESAIKITKTLPDGTIGGVPSYHYAYTIDPAGVDDLIDAAVQAGNDMAKQESSTVQTIDASTTAQMKDQANAALSALGSLGGEIWIGKSDHYPHQVTFAASFSTSTPAYGSATGTVNVTSTITDINGGQTVTAPANAESFADIFAYMLTGAPTNSPELLAQGRDANRISDLATLKSAISLYSVDMPTPDFACTNKKTIYASAPITPPPGWTAGAHMGSRAVNGTGWIPIDFASVSSGSPLGKLPVDPSNNPKKHLVYLFACDPSNNTYELDAVMESKKYGNGGSSDIVSTDGGNDPNVYEVGTDLSLIPDNFWR